MRYITFTATYYKKKGKSLIFSDALIIIPKQPILLKMKDRMINKIKYSNIFRNIKKCLNT